jgi:ribosomal protein L7Ae-like RNA K-turn-binding protein
VNFIDWLLGLPKALEVEFWQELQAYEEERKVPYITIESIDDLTAWLEHQG